MKKESIRQPSGPSPGIPVKKANGPPECMKVNFITEINGFYRFIQTRQLSSNAQLLWFHLFCLWNSVSFPVWLQVDLNRMMTMIQANSRSTAERARNELVAAGRLRCIRGKSRQPNSYQFVLFDSPARLTAIPTAKAGDQTSRETLPHTVHQNSHQKRHHKANPAPAPTAPGVPLGDHSGGQTEYEPLPLYKLNDTKPQKEKEAYGQFGNVRLSRKELSMLQNDFPDTWEDWIRRLDLGKETHNYVYANDYAAICSWQEKETAAQRDKAFQEMMAEWEIFHG